MNLSFKKGFSLLELVVSVSILSILFGVVVVNLLNVKQKASLSSAVETLINDLKNQQLKAMVGDTEGRASADNYGIYFGTTSYTLFHGNYSVSEPSNFTTLLGDNIEFAGTTFPNSYVTFTVKNGEVLGATGNNTITIRDTQNQEQKTVTVNQYGVVTAVN